MIISHDIVINRNAAPLSVSKVTFANSPFTGAFSLEVTFVIKIEQGTQRNQQMRIKI